LTNSSFRNTMLTYLYGYMGIALLVEPLLIN